MAFVCFKPLRSQPAQVWASHSCPVSSPVVRTTRSKRVTMLPTLRRSQRADESSTAECSHLVALDFHALPGEVYLRFCMGFEATPLAHTPVTVFSLRVLVPRLTWSVLHSCVVSNASSLSPADAVPPFEKFAVLLSSTMVKFPCGRTCPR